MVFGNWVKNIQAAAYNSARTVYYQNHNFGLNQFKQESSFILIVSFNKRNQLEKHKNIPGIFVIFPELCRDLEP